jgi:hypothetical protein
LRVAAGHAAFAWSETIFAAAACESTTFSTDRSSRPTSLLLLAAAKSPSVAASLPFAGPLILLQLILRRGHLYPVKRAANREAGDGLVGATDWAATGSEGPEAVIEAMPMTEGEQEKPRVSGASVESG